MDATFRADRSCQYELGNPSLPFSHRITAAAVFMLTTTCVSMGRPVYSGWSSGGCCPEQCGPCIRVQGLARPWTCTDLADVLLSIAILPAAISATALFAVRMPLTTLNTAQSFSFMRRTLTSSELKPDAVRNSLSRIESEIRGIRISGTCPWPACCLMHSASTTLAASDQSLYLLPTIQPERMAFQCDRLVAFERHGGPAVSQEREAKARYLLILLATTWSTSTGQAWNACA